MSQVEPNDKKVDKKKKVTPTSPSTSTRSKTTKSAQSKKKPKPKVYEKKPLATTKRGRQLILQEEFEIESKEESKKLKATGKKSKPVSDASKPSAPIEIKSLKPMSHFERTLKYLKRKQLHDVKDYFDSFDDKQKEEVVNEVINYLYQNDLSPDHIQKDISDSLYSILDVKCKEAIDQEHKLIDKFFVEYFSDLTQDKLLDLFLKKKGLFHFRAMRLKLLIGKIDEAKKYIHSIAKNIVEMEKWRQESQKFPKIDIGAPSELETEEIEVADVVYAKKGGKESNSPLAIFDNEDDEDNNNKQDTIHTTSITSTSIHAQEQQQPV